MHFLTFLISFQSCHTCSLPFKNEFTVSAENNDATNAHQIPHSQTSAYGMNVHGKLFQQNTFHLSSASISILLCGSNSYLDHQKALCLDNILSTSKDNFSWIRNTYVLRCIKELSNHTTRVMNLSIILSLWHLISSLKAHIKFFSYCNWRNDTIMF